MTIRDRVPALPLVRVRVLSSAVKETGKPRVHGYVWAPDVTALRARQDLLTCWTYEQGWLLSKVFTDAQPGFGPGVSALLETIRGADVHAVVMVSQDSYSRAIARRIERSGTPCLVLPGEVTRTVLS